MEERTHTVVICTFGIVSAWHCCLVVRVWGKGASARAWPSVGEVLLPHVSQISCHLTGQKKKKEGLHTTVTQRQD